MISFNPLFEVKRVLRGGTDVVLFWELHKIAGNML
jgi:hypothetical protein